MGFAVVGGASGRRLAVEAVGAAASAPVALLGLRVSACALALGWAGYAGRDALLHGFADVAFVPGW